jgi:endonuclease/exonuclease/phosphatase family metal-dependent hydrolase
MLRVEVAVAGQSLTFVTTHLDYQFPDGRLFETEQLLRFLGDVKGPLIVAGDFNDEPAGSSYQLMRKTFADSWLINDRSNAGLSFPAGQPTKRIDYIFLRQRDRIRAMKAWTVNSLASDHLPVVAEIKL